MVHGDAVAGRQRRERNAVQRRVRHEHDARRRKLQRRPDEVGQSTQMLVGTLEQHRQPRAYVVLAVAALLDLEAQSLDSPRQLGSPCRQTHGARRVLRDHERPRRALPHEVLDQLRLFRKVPLRGLEGVRFAPRQRTHGRTARFQPEQRLRDLGFARPGGGRRRGFGAGRPVRPVETAVIVQASPQSIESAEQRDEAADFLAYRPIEFEQPSTQTVANVVNLAALVLVPGAPIRIMRAGVCLSVGGLSATMLAPRGAPSGSSRL